MAFQELLKVHSVKHVEQKAFHGGGSHRGVPGCVDCGDTSEGLARGRRAKSAACAGTKAGARSLESAHSSTRM